MAVVVQCGEIAYSLPNQTRRRAVGSRTRGRMALEWSMGDVVDRWRDQRQACKQRYLGRPFCSPWGASTDHGRLLTAQHCELSSQQAEDCRALP